MDSALSAGRFFRNCGQKENDGFMNIQEMLSRMNPDMLAKGLRQISEGLSAEQLKQAEAAIKGAGIDGKLGGLDINSLQKELQSNPKMLKSLVQNPELISKLQAIVKNK